jgi:iron complex transport system substrate-binding protein
MAARSKGLILLLVLTGGLKASGYPAERMIDSGVVAVRMMDPGVAAERMMDPGVAAVRMMDPGVAAERMMDPGVAAVRMMDPGVAAGAVAGDLQVSGSAPRRVVSLVPALTEVLFAIGAGPQVVAVSSYDEFPPDVKKLPRVGALLDPDSERILALRPDLVLLYGSQSSQETQFARAKIRTYSYRHGGIATALDTIRELGALTGRQVDAARVVRDVQTRLDAVRASVKGRARPRVLLVFERQPRTLRELYVSGGRGFLHEMLEIAGGQNVFSDVDRESVQPSTETLLARAPEVIVEVQTRGMLEAREVIDEQNVWSSLTSIPAVRNKRIHILSGDYLVVPGPRLAQATEAFAQVIHGVKAGPDAGRSGVRPR